MFISNLIRRVSFAATIAASATIAHSAAIPTTGFTGVAVTPSGNQRSDVANVIDGNLGTKSFVTTSGTQGIATVYLDLGTARNIVGLRWLKVSQDIDGTQGANDPMELTFQTTATSTATGLTSRTYANVANLTNGYEGNELLQFASGGGINPVTATASKENGLGDDDPGVAQADAFYSVTWDPALAVTAISITFTPSQANIFTHYYTYEFQAITLPEPCTAGALGAAGMMLVSRRRRQQRRFAC